VKQKVPSKFCKLHVNHSGWRHITEHRMDVVRVYGQDTRRNSRFLGGLAVSNKTCMTLLALTYVCRVSDVDLSVT
jgi:hypothetical protein